MSRVLRGWRMEDGELNLRSIRILKKRPDSKRSILYLQSSILYSAITSGGGLGSMFLTIVPRSGEYTFGLLKGWNGREVLESSGDRRRR